MVRPESPGPDWHRPNERPTIGNIDTDGRCVCSYVPESAHLTERIGNPQEIVAALGDKRKLEPSGEPSLQNGLVMAKGGMG